MWAGLSRQIFNGFFPFFGLCCLPSSAPGSLLDNYDKGRISPWALCLVAVKEL